MTIERQAYRPKTIAEWQEEFCERAAMIEYEGGLSRADAEALALKIVGSFSREEAKKKTTKKTRVMSPESATAQDCSDDDP